MKLDQFSSDKIIYNSRLDNIINNKIVIPSVVELSLSGMCNQECKYCGCNKVHDSVFLQKKQFDALLAQIYPYINAVTLTGGGDPLVSPIYNYCLARLTQHHISIGLITNGQGFDNESIDSTVKFLKYCRVSLDSVNNLNYRRIRGERSNLGLVLENIQKLTQRKKRTASNILLGTQIVLFDQSLEDVEQTIIYSRGIGIDYVQIRPVDSADENIRKQYASLYRSMYQDIVNLCKKHTALDLILSQRPWKLEVTAPGTV